MRANPVKKALKAGQPAVGAWLLLGSIPATRFMARAGFSWLIVDVEHSLVDWETATHMLASIADAGCTAVARVPANRHDHIKRALDNGAHGVIVPMVNSRAEAEAAVAACRFPPVGNRSIGGSVHALNFAATSAEYYARANDEVLVVLQCEHIQAVRNADEIFSVPGIDVIYVGPNDLAASMRDKDGRPPSAQAMAEASEHILATCKKYGVAAGYYCTSAEEVRRRIKEGWQLLTLSSDLEMMLDGAASVLHGIGLPGSGEISRY